MTAPFEPGLYIVATPIGNLADLTRRAEAVLGAADLILVEDSRVTGKLLHHIGKKGKMRVYNDHKQAEDREDILNLARCKIVALVSDAGTPLISDPGYKLVRDARAAGIMVTTAPGPSAAIAALTLSGLPSDRFLFEGFLPSKEKARRDVLTTLGPVQATLVFYESGPRLASSLAAMADALGDREAAVVREITKRFEETVTGSLRELSEIYRDAPPKGEIVVVVGPPGEPVAADQDSIESALRTALLTQSVSKAAGQVARQFGADRRALYDLATRWKGEQAE